MVRAGDTAALEITGVRRSPAGAVVLVEIEAASGGRRVSFGQAPLDDHTQAHGVAIDARPVTLVVPGPPLAVVALRVPLGLPLPEAQPVGAFGEASVKTALAAHVPLFADGLYSVSMRALPTALKLGPDVLTAPATPLVVDPGPIAPDGGTPVVADLGGGLSLLLGGRAALRRGAEALVVSASFLVAADGFEARRHDRAARERFARAPSVLFDDAKVRDALTAHALRHPEAALGPFGLDRVEPASQLAARVALDVESQDGVSEVRGPERASNGRTVEYKLGVECGGHRFVVGLSTDDGRRLFEATIRRGGAYRATGVKPTARAIARVLREIAREEGT